MKISKERLARIDLNLLVALRVLLEVKKVTHAADRLYLTQSAMSRILKRLRELFGDPLLVRISREFVLTPKAAELFVPLVQILDRLDGLVFSKEFDPAEAMGVINIAAPPYVMGDIIIKLTDHIDKEAPGLQIIAQNNLIDYIPHTGYIDMLRLGMLDIAKF
jgi:DNA-binding transcriptional LysR family regulator